MPLFRCISRYARQPKLYVVSCLGVGPGAVREPVFQLTTHVEEVVKAALYSCIVRGEDVGV